MRTEEEILKTVSISAELLDTLDTLIEAEHTPEQIDGILAVEAEAAGAKALSADFHRGMYQALTWVLGTNYAEDLDTGAEHL